MLWRWKMLNWKNVVIFILGLGIVASATALIATQRAYNFTISETAKLKEQSKKLQDKLTKTEATYSQLQDENAQLKKEGKRMSGSQPVLGEDESQSRIKKLEYDLKQKQGELDALQEKYAL